MLKRALLTLVVICGLAVLVTAYLVVRPQRDAARFICILELVQVGHTRTQDVAPALRSAGAVAGVKGGNCEADLNGPPRTKALHPTDSNGGSLLPAELQRVCGYNLYVDNKFLHRLRLAPLTDISVAIGPTDGTVDQIILFYATGDFGNVGLVRFIQSIAGKATACGLDTCVLRSYGSDGAVVKIRIQVAADAPSSERNRLLSIDAHCLSKIGGCKNASELLPIGD